MALRKASAYSKKKFRPYTRKSSVKKKSYIKTVPVQKIVKFNMGDRKSFENKKFKYVLKLLSTEKVQIRDNAIEASRLIVQKTLERAVPGMYFFEIKIYPHQILRENKMLTGAGADRMQSGMKHSFGKTAGRAAIVKPNQELFLVAVETPKAVKIARKALSLVKPKFPCKTQITFEEQK